MSDLVVIFRTPSPIEADVVRGRPSNARRLECRRDTEPAVLRPDGRAPGTGLQPSLVGQGERRITHERVARRRDEACLLDHPDCGRALPKLIRRFRFGRAAVGRRIRIGPAELRRLVRVAELLPARVRLRRMCRELGGQRRQSEPVSFDHLPDLIGWRQCHGGDVGQLEPCHPHRLAKTARLEQAQRARLFGVGASLERRRIRVSRPPHEKIDEPRAEPAPAPFARDDEIHAMLTPMDAPQRQVRGEGTRCGGRCVHDPSGGRVRPVGNAPPLRLVRPVRKRGGEECACRYEIVVAGKSRFRKPHPGQPCRDQSLAGSATVRSP